MDSRVLQTQKWLNDTYGNVANFPKVDEDGITGNSTFHALIYALQIEIGVENPDGIFGKDTLSKCPTLRASLLPSSEVPRNIIYILQGSLWCKGISPGGFTGVFGPLTANAISEFQTAAGITADKVVYPYVLQGIMNTDSYSFQSTEDIYDTDRNATALDTSTKLTLEDAIAIKQKNYTDVGRYLTNASSNGLDKALSLDEMEILIAVGLNVFPIFQTIGNKVSYFTAQQGLADGLAAKEAAQKFGFPPSATIYFCIDYNVLMADIEGNILPLGLPQIMEFNYSFAGYSSAKDMFDSFCIDEYTQVAAFGRFIAAYDNGSLLSACQQRDFFEMAKIYNGNGEAYKPKLEKNTADYANAL